MIKRGWHCPQLPTPSTHAVQQLMDNRSSCCWSSVAGQRVDRKPLRAVGMLCSQGVCSELCDKPHLNTVHRRCAEKWGYLARARPISCGTARLTLSRCSDFILLNLPTLISRVRQCEQHLGKLGAATVPHKTFRWPAASPFSAATLASQPPTLCTYRTRRPSGSLQGSWPMKPRPR